MSNQCPPGKILRKGFSRKAHSRKSYQRKNSSKVKKSFVRRSEVPSTCVPDTGAPGKTPESRKILPKLGTEVSLRKYGYSTKKSSAQRQKSLKRASAKFGPLKVLRRLNLIRNYQPDPNAKEIMGEDVTYMSDYYQGRLKSNSTKTSRKTKSKNKKNR